MKKISKALSLILVIAMVAGLFAGCSATPEGKALLDATLKAQNIKSAETKTTVKVSLDASGLTPQEEVQFSQVKSMIDGSELYISTKSEMKDKLAGKAEIKMTGSAGGMSVGTTIWVDTDMNGNTMKLKEVIEIPEVIGAFMPEKYAGKKYMVMDMDKMTKSAEMKKALNGMDMSKLTTFSKNMSVKMIDLAQELAKNYNPGFKFITDLGVKEIETASGKVNAHVYQVKLDDKTAKELVRYTVTNLANNKSAMAFVKDYMNMVMEIAGSSATPAEKKEIEKMLKDMEAGVPKFVAEFNKAMDSVKDVKIIDDKGIVMNYAIGDNGYIINENGSMNFVIDVAAWSKLAGETAKSAAKYKLGLDYNTDVYNIDKAVKVELPTLTAQNSFDYVDMIMSMVGQGTGNQPAAAATKEIKTVNLSKKYTVTVKGQQYIQAKYAVDTLKGKYTYTKGIAKIEYNGKVIEFKPATTKAKVNGKEINLTKSNGLIKDKVLYISNEVLEKIGVKAVVK